jgi:hypothetical protein
MALILSERSSKFSAFPRRRDTPQLQHVSSPLHPPPSLPWRRSRWAAGGGALTPAQPPPRSPCVAPLSLPAPPRVWPPTPSTPHHHLRVSWACAEARSSRVRWDATSCRDAAPHSLSVSLSLCLSLCLCLCLCLCLSVSLSLSLRTHRLNLKAPGPTAAPTPVQTRAGSTRESAAGAHVTEGKRTGLEVVGHLKPLSSGAKERRGGAPVSRDIQPRQHPRGPASVASVAPSWAESDPPTAHRVTPLSGRDDDAGRQWVSRVCGG